MTQATLTPQATALVDEFKLQVAGLSEADCYKSAFAVFALHRGYSKAKIARYLGLTRARVGQKVQKCEEYARRGQMPVLASLLESTQYGNGTDHSDDPIAYTKDDWLNPEFAVGMVNRVA